MKLRWLPQIINIHLKRITETCWIWTSRLEYGNWSLSPEKEIHLLSWDSEIYCILRMYLLWKSANKFLEFISMRIVREKLRWYYSGRTWHGTGTSHRRNHILTKKGQRNICQNMVSAQWRVSDKFFTVFWIISLLRRR